MLSPPRVKLRLTAIYVPKEYGGAGLDTLHYAIAVEEVGRVCGSTGIFLAAHSSLGVFPIYYAGNDEQKRKWLIPLAKGEKIGSFGLTEPDAGSDAAATKTTAKREGDNYVINGGKRFITSDRHARTITGLPQLDPDGPDITTRGLYNPLKVGGWAAEFGLNTLVVET